MATAAQNAANQANARRSTSPCTGQGKAASARNSTTHGICSKDFVSLEGEEQEFADFMANLQASLHPVGVVEFDIFTQHAHASWGLSRCRRAEVASQFHAVCKGSDPLLTADMANRLSGELLHAGIDSIAELPPLVNPIHINRQRSANARTQSATASADEKESFRLAARTMAEFRTQVADHYAGLHKQTQSPAQVAFAAGGQN